MRWAITGTPGTGKTTVASNLSLDIPVTSLAEILDDEGFISGYDPDRDTEIIDLDALVTWLKSQPSSCVIESHVSHLLPVDAVIVLRCHPEELVSRLEHRYGNGQEQRIAENIESERHDIILIEALKQHDNQHVYEIDTTPLSIAEVTNEVNAIIEGNRTPQSGIVSFLEDA